MKRLLTVLLLVLAGCPNRQGPTCPSGEVPTSIGCVMPTTPGGL